jgi:hypothetical protein
LTFRDGKRVIEGRLRGIDLRVLVWGSGPTYVEHHAKRVEIRDALRAHFVAADVSFSEELRDVPEWGAHLGHHERELWHLAICDIAVVLDTSKGSGEEIAHFTGTADARKLFILTDEQYRGVDSFPAALREKQNQVFYTAAEYRNCDVVKHVMERVKQVALVKLLSLSN